MGVCVCLGWAHFLCWVLGPQLGLLIFKFELKHTGKDSVDPTQNEIQHHILQARRNPSLNTGLEWSALLRHLPKDSYRSLHLLAQACGVPAVGVLAVNCWQWRSGHYFHPSLLFFFSPGFFFPFFSPPFFFSRFFSSLRPFLIEVVLESKNLFSESCLERPKT